ncbi:MAG: PH domain-containing protein [Clostridia bacterium]|nr:PH domain-containing protein [Clostridia bacterium]
MVLLTDGRKVTILWLIRILFASFAAILLSLELLHVSPLIGTLACAATLLPAAFFGCWYLPAYFRRYAAYLDGDVIRITHGVISRRTTVVPLAHVLTVTVAASPLMHLFRLRFLTLGLPSHRYWLHAVGTAEAELLVSLCGSHEVEK